MRLSLFALVLVVGLVPAGAALAEDPHPAVAPTLTGETLTAVQGKFAVSCDPTGAGTVMYRVTGVAAGPYPGTFRESGTLTFTRGPRRETPVLIGFKATFTILSEVGRVDGTKTFLRSRTPLLGTCTNAAAAVADVRLRYEATIETRTGIFRDEGLSRATFSAVEPSTIALTETFASSLETAEVILDPPGNSFPIQPGQGCGDENHFHEDEALCRVPHAIDVEEPA